MGIYTPKCSFFRCRAGKPHGRLAWPTSPFDVHAIKPAAPPPLRLYPQNVSHVAFTSLLPCVSAHSRPLPAHHRSNLLQKQSVCLPQRRTKRRRVLDSSPQCLPAQRLVASQASLYLQPDRSAKCLKRATQAGSQLHDDVQRIT